MASLPDQGAEQVWSPKEEGSRPEGSRPEPHSEPLGCAGEALLEGTNPRADCCGFWPDQRGHVQLKKLHPITFFHYKPG